MEKNKQILLFDRLDSSIYPGGDTVQINAIGKFLEENGYKVTIEKDPRVNLACYDFVLIFNLTQPYDAYLQARAAVRYQKPYLLFPIYWDLDSLVIDQGLKYKNVINRMVSEELKPFIRSIQYWQRNKSILKDLGIPLSEICNRNKLINFILTYAKYVFPNSYAELNHLLSCFNIENLKEKCYVVYNGVNIKKILSIAKQIRQETQGFSDEYICCVGAIGPRKNQLNLVKAANITGITTFIIGKVSRGSERYAEKVKKIANKNVIFFDFLKQEELFSIIKKSRGHVQPSYIETPGLASMEAAALGVPIGVSDVPPVKEYFRDYAYYCDPRSPDSIASCMHNVLNSNTEHKKFANYILDNYRWNLVLNDLIHLLEKNY